MLFEHNLVVVANRFCAAFLDKLLSSGFIFTCEMRRMAVTGDEVLSTVPVVYLRHRGKDRASLDENNAGAIALGNTIDFCEHGPRVRVKSLQYGVLAGGPVYDELLKDPDGEKQKALVHHLGVGKDFGCISARDFNEMRAFVEVTWKELLEHLAKPGDERKHARFIEKGKDLINKLDSILVAARPQDDEGVWQIIQEEVLERCPNAFGTLSEAQRRQIFHRVKVRLGLAEDDL
jgi:hypothetical protein